MIDRRNREKPIFITHNDLCQSVQMPSSLQKELALYRSRIHTNFSSAKLQFALVYPDYIVFLLETVEQRVTKLWRLRKL